MKAKLSLAFICLRAESEISGKCHHEHLFLIAFSSDYPNKLTKKFKLEQKNQTIET
jgi:hypothetical protein